MMEAPFLDLTGLEKSMHTAEKLSIGLGSKLCPQFTQLLGISVSMIQLLKNKKQNKKKKLCSTPCSHRHLFPEML